MKNIYKIEDELYIISDKEKSSYCIKECPMAGLNINRCDCQIFTACSNKVGNIILTTNNLLIKDGVQAIDVEFLEWFVKNPSCEEVEVEQIKEYINCMSGKELCQLVCDKCSYYKIIIPKEEPKQFENEFEFQSRIINKVWDEDEQGTLEEAAKNYAIDNSLIGYELMPYKGFIKEKYKLQRK